jgi:hypothetical protein
VDTLQDGATGEWFAIAEAAKYIRRSEKTIERLHTERRLNSMLFPRSRRRPERRFSKASLDLYRASQILRERAISTPHFRGEKGSYSHENRFIFQLQEGPIVLTCPGKVDENNLSIALDFLRLVERQLQNAYGTTEQLVADTRIER